MRKISPHFIIFFVFSILSVSFVYATPNSKPSDKVKDFQAKALGNIEPMAGQALRSLDYTASQQIDYINAVLPNAIQPPKWLKHAVSYNVDKNKPMIAIVIDDMGVNQRKSYIALTLPAPLTFAYLPYAKDLPEQAKVASTKGHELLIHMPMQPEHSQQNPGPDALIEGLTRAEFKQRLQKNLAAFDGYVGINNHMGSKLSKNHDMLSIVMSELKKKELLYLDSRTTAKTIGEKTALEYDLPTTHRDVFLDHVITEEAVFKSLQKTEAIALKKGSAVAIGHPHKITIDVLVKWLPQAREKGFQIVPLTTVVKKRDHMLEYNNQPFVQNGKIYLSSSNLN